MENIEKLNLFLIPVENTFVLPIENKTLLTSDKSDLSEMASMIVEAVDDGNADPLDTLIMAKKMNYVSESIIEAMKGKASIDGQDNYSKHNVNIRSQVLGARYSYDTSNHPEWNDLNIQMLELKEKITAIEVYLKSLKCPTEFEEVINEDTGEVVYNKTTIYPAVKSGSEGLVCTIK